MRTINAKRIANLVSSLCIKANIDLRPDVKKAIKSSIKKERNKSSKDALRLLIMNSNIARENRIPICQDTGATVVFMEIGQNVKIKGSLKKAVTKGVRDGYVKGYLRKSIVASPISRINTNDNTPPVLHTSVVAGKNIKIWVMPKGFGSENKSSIRMLNPNDGQEAIIDFVVETVKKAGAEACPPLVLGVGIGGTFDYAAYLAKKALLKPIDKKNADKLLASLEQKIFNAVNKLNIGPMGLGGRTTVLGVNISSYATHIAGLPVAVNVNCHATRSAYGVI